MSLFNLKSLVSKEDFADSHEPVNDGVKKVPTAADIAASVGSGEGGTDTSNAGPAKIIPEKEETGDKTEKQFDTVAETAEKGGSDKGTPPAKPDTDNGAPPAKPADTDKDESDTKPPFPPKKDEAATTDEEKPEPVDAPLEHETKEAAEDEQKKTDTVTKSLENYSLHASRFDVVGYPKVERGRIQKRMNWLARRTDQPVNQTISAESISHMVDVGRQRGIALGNQVKVHAQRKAALESIGDIPYTPTPEVPAETSIDNLDVDLGAGLAEREVDPLDVGIIGINQVAETLEVLENAQVAVEKHIAILRNAPFISQQAAAVLQAGLEHIDRVCGLKVRATGLEGYDTSPRSAMAKADISIESLNTRAADIGAKILKWIAQILEQASTQWHKYQAGLTGMLSDARKVKDQIDGLKGNPGKDTLTLKTNSNMYMGSEFVGNTVHPNVMAAPKFLKTQYGDLRNDLAGDFTTILNSGDGDTLERLKQVGADQAESTTAELELPGGVTLVRKGLTIETQRGEEPAHPGAVEVELNRVEMRRQIANSIKCLEQLGDGGTLAIIKGAQESIGKVLIAFRKGAGKDLEETERQQIQSYVIGEASKTFSVTSYFTTVSYLTKQVATVVRLHEVMAKAWGEGSDE